MKNLSLALVCFALAACGNTPKNEVTKTIPSPQQAESQEAFESRCRLKDSSGIGRGELNRAGTMCQKVIAMYSKGRENDKDYVQTEESHEETLGDKLPPGFFISGTFEGSALAPALTVNDVREDVPSGTTILMERSGTVRLTTYRGSYKTLLYKVSACFSRGNSYVSCKGF